MGLSFKMFQKSDQVKAVAQTRPWLSVDVTRKACELDIKAQEIITSSNSPSHTSYKPGRGIKAMNVINDMFRPECFEDKTIIEFGPGHYSFSLLARHLGATVICVEYDPSLVALGEYLGFEVQNTNLDVITRDYFARRFNGLWQRLF